MAVLHTDHLIKRPRESRWFSFTIKIFMKTTTIYLILCVFNIVYIIYIYIYWNGQAMIQLWPGQNPNRTLNFMQCRNPSYSKTFTNISCNFYCLHFTLIILKRAECYSTFLVWVPQKKESQFEMKCEDLDTILMIYKFKWII